MLHPCLDCGVATRTPRRCSDCARRYDRARRPRPTERYGPGYQRRHREAVEAEPWCHWPGCRYAITASNPLTADHPIRVADGGDPDQPLVPMCRRHNSGRR